MDVHGIGGDVKAQIVSCPICLAGLDAAARHPHRERLRVVVAAETASQSNVGLNHRRAAKLPPPDHQRVVEQPALL